MFSKVSNASKIALVGLCEHLINKGIDIIDCQVASDHLFSMGAVEIPRSLFMQFLQSISLAEKQSPDRLTHHNFAIGVENAINKL